MLTHQQRIARRREMALFVKDGNSRNEAARHFGVHVTTIKHACMENDVSVPVTIQSKAESSTQFDILTELLGGASRAEVMSALGVSRQYIHSVVKCAEQAGLMKLLSKELGRKIVI